MNKTQKIALGGLFGLVIFCLVPVTLSSVTMTVPPMNYLQVTLSTVGGESSGSFTSTGTVTAFITNSSSHGGSPPGDALWTTTGTSGTWAVVFTGSGPWYLVFTNAGLSSVQVSYEIVRAIPGFEWMFTLFTLVTIFGLIFLKRRSLL